MDLPATAAPALGIVEHRDVTLLPACHLRGHWISFTTGAFDATGAPLPEFAHRRLHATNPPEPAPTAPPQARHDGPFLYGGVLFGHYGHFLMESLARAWAFDRCPDLPVLWHVHAGHRDPGLAGWQGAIFDLLGLGGRVHVLVRAPMRLGRVLVPEPGSVLGRLFHPDLAARLAVHGFRPPRPGRRVWLSRSALRKMGGKIEGEDRLEALLAAQGWDIYHPQRDPIALQLGTLADAGVLSGFAGSAFHTLVLGARVRARVVILARGGAGAMLHNYDVPARAKGLRQDIAPLRLAPLGGQGAARSWLLEDPALAVAAIEGGLARLGAADTPAQGSFT
jgi:capsular polysaccharide biosynthesis protein